MSIGLPKHTELNVTVSALTAVGLGPASQPVKVKTREGGKFVTHKACLHNLPLWVDSPFEFLEAG